VTPAFNFVVPADSDDELDALCRLDPDRDWNRFTGGVFCWTLLTGLILKQRGLPVLLSRESRADAINLAHAVQLRRIPPRTDRFVVSLQADYPRIPWAQLHVVQNPAQLGSAAAYWMPHWPQPGLVPRDPSRRGVRCAAYAGREYWLAGSPDSWRRALAELGIEFRMMEPDGWNDLSGVDILLAIRSFDRKTYRGQPPTKLLNAWHAGIPLVAGNDSAFAAVGRPGEDYLSVTTRDEAIEAIRRLKDDPSFHDRIVTHGRARAAEYTRDRIADRWSEFLQGAACAAYETWRRRGRAAQLAWRIEAAGAQMSCALRDASRRAARLVLGGARLHQIRNPFR
jgi:hypothetical protein